MFHGSAHGGNSATSGSEIVVWWFFPRGARSGADPEHTRELRELKELRELRFDSDSLRCCGCHWMLSIVGPPLWGLNANSEALGGAECLGALLETEALAMTPLPSPRLAVPISPKSVPISPMLRVLLMFLSACRIAAQRPPRKATTACFPRQSLGTQTLPKRHPCRQPELLHAAAV